MKLLASSASRWCSCRRQPDGPALVGVGLLDVAAREPVVEVQVVGEGVEAAELVLLGHVVQLLDDRVAALGQPRPAQVGQQRHQRERGRGAVVRQRPGQRHRFEGRLVPRVVVGALELQRPAGQQPGPKPDLGLRHLGQGHPDPLEQLEVGGAVDVLAPEEGTVPGRDGSGDQHRVAGRRGLVDRAVHGVAQLEAARVAVGPHQPYLQVHPITWVCIGDPLVQGDRLVPQLDRGRQRGPRLGLFRGADGVADGPRGRDR